MNIYFCPINFIGYALYWGQLTISQQNILATGKSLTICKTAVTLEPVWQFDWLLHFLTVISIGRCYLMNGWINKLIVTMFVEQPLALSRSAKDDIFFLVLRKNI